MSFFGFGSGSARLSNVDDFAPKKKARKRNGKNGRNGKKNGRNGRNGNGSAKRAAEGFESPGFFGGLESGKGFGGIPKSEPIQDVGVELPALGEGFNSRIGNIGSGFTENVNPFKIGFTDILTGNGRTGEIIGGGAGGVTSGFGKRKRGRPKGSGKKQKLAGLGSGIVPRKPATLTTKGAKKLKAEALLLTKAGDIEGARAKLSQIKTKSVGGLLKDKAGAGLSGIRESIRDRKTKGLGSAISFQAEEFGGDELSGQQGPVAERAGGFRGTKRAELDLEGRIDEEQVGRFRQRIAAERESESSIDELVEEENGLDEDLEDVEDSDDFDTQGEGFEGPSR